MVKRLTDANTELQSYLTSRSLEKSTKVAGALKNSRAAVDEAWREFVLYVNAAAVIFGIEDYESYIDFAITEINRIRQQVFGETVSSSSSSSSSNSGDSSSSGGSSSGGGSSSSDDGSFNI